MISVGDFRMIVDNTTRHPGYAVSQWLRKTRYRGRARVQWHAYLVAAAYNLLRIAPLAPAPA